MPGDTTCRKIQSWHCTGWSGRQNRAGHLDAQLDLGLLYLESGDAESGRQWLIIAGAGGSVQAQYQLFRY